MKNTIQNIKHTLANLYPPEEIQAMIYVIFEHVKSYSKTDMILNSHTKLNQIEQNQINDIVERLKTYEPLQYIIGQTEFYGHPFYVNPSVLIPRPETEELVQKAISLYNNTAPINILDLGTGSGCIAISLAKHYVNAKVSASDISEESLNTAGANAKLNDVSIDFILDDMLSSKISGEFDIIVSNPPYIIPEQKLEMSRNVLHYEPHYALFVPTDNPLIFYKAVAKIASKLLISDGYCMVEINEIYGQQTKVLMESYLRRDAEIIKDINGKDRMIICRKM